jgi:tetratricopeptide (TPR) repeat protein
MLKNLDEFYKALGEKEVDDFIANTWFRDFAMPIYKSKDYAYYEEGKKEKAFQNYPKHDRIVWLVDGWVAKQVKKDMQEWGDVTIKLMEKYPSDNPNKLNELAWGFYENFDDPEMLKPAAEWAKQSVEAAPGYANMDTYAALLYKLKRKDEAEEWAQKAISTGKATGQNTAETEALLKKIQAL